MKGRPDSIERRRICSDVRCAALQRSVVVLKDLPAGKGMEKREHNIGVFPFLGGRSLLVAGRPPVVPAPRHGFDVSTTPLQLTLILMSDSSGVQHLR